MNNDFDRKPEEGGADENPIRRGYGETPAPAEEKPEYRFKAEMPEGTPAPSSSSSGASSGTNANYYYDYTSTTNTAGVSSSSAGVSSEDQARSENAANISLILGGIGTALVWFCCGGLFVSLLLGIIGLVYAGKSRSPLTRQRSGKGTAGFVLSLISTILGALTMLFWIFYVVIIVFAIIAGEGEIADEGGIYVRAAIDALSRMI